MERYLQRDKKYRMPKIKKMKHNHGEWESGQEVGSKNENLAESGS